MPPSYCFCSAVFYCSFRFSFAGGLLKSVEASAISVPILYRSDDAVLQAVNAWIPFYWWCSALLFVCGAAGLFISLWSGTGRLPVRVAALFPGDRCDLQPLALPRKGPGISSTRPRVPNASTQHLMGNGGNVATRSGIVHSWSDNKDANAHRSS
jgi:hypothetical protein